MKILKLYCIFSLVYISAYAQYPGGVSANLRGWFKGNVGVTLAAGEVSVWADQSGNGLNATQTTAARRPNPNTAGFNYNPTINFNGQDQFLNVPDLMATSATGVSAFAVARQTDDNQDTWGCVILGQANGPAWTGGGYGLTALNVGNTSFGFWVRDYSANFVAKTTGLTVPTLMSGVWNGITANTINYYQDGVSQGTDNYTPGSVGDNGNTYIGTGYGTGTQYCFYGDIAEVIVYNTGLSATNADKINSYMAVKYGITLPVNYLNSAGATIFSPAASYTSNIIGIGRDDNNSLTQKQSHNMNDSVRIYLSTLAASNTANTGAFTNTLSYVMMGANVGKLSGVHTEKPASVFSRLAREWKVTNTNFPSTFNIDVKLTAASVLGSVSVADLRLLVDNDGDFSNATVYGAGGGLSFSYSNPVITVAGISTVMIAQGSTSYITIASAAGTTPLPIELLNFEAKSCNNYVCLDWQTETEKNNHHFAIDRSNDGLEWDHVTDIAGAINSSQVVSYSFTDDRPNRNQSYYKLQAYNTEGLGDYSKIASVNLSETNQELNAYPNPVDNFLLIEGINPGENISLCNSSGRSINNLNYSQVTDGRIRLNTEDLLDGVYYLKITNTRSQHNRIKIVVIH